MIKKTIAKLTDAVRDPIWCKLCTGMVDVYNAWAPGDLVLLPHSEAKRMFARGSALPALPREIETHLENVARLAAAQEVAT